MSQITTHVLDISLGRPAANVNVTLEAQTAGSEWAVVGRGSTDGDGRLNDLAAGKALNPGTHRLTFGTGAYFALRKIDALYPQVIIAFEVRDARDHYHIPLLLSPFGYSTYRGS
jgi:5-hydroxyisourate hydrolase